MLFAGTSAVLLAVQPTSAHVPVLVVYLCGALALLGLYGMLAPLLHLPPWQARADMNRLIRRQWRGIKWRRRVRRLLRRPAPKEEHIMLTTEPPPIDENEPVGPDAVERVEIEHEPIRWDQINVVPEAGEEPVPMEAWLQDRVDAHAKLVRRRAVRTDKWFRAALGKWDERNLHELYTKVAPDLVGSYRGNPPGHLPDAEHEKAYFDRQLAWLKDTLRGLREGTPATDQSPRDAFLKVLAEIAEQGHEIPFPDTEPRAYGGWSMWAHRQIASFDVAYAAEFNSVEDSMSERQRKLQDIMRAVRTSGSHLGPGDGSRG
jgi:hypothetical protein